MSEPTSTAAGAGIALGAVTITGTILGMHYDALLVGFIAALLALMHLPPDEAQPKTPLRVFAFVAAGSFVAGVFAPAAALAAADQIELLRKLEPGLLRIMAAAAIGATLHLVLPAVRSMLPAVIERLRALIGGAR